MSLDISLLHFRIAARSVAVRADSSSSSWPNLLLSMRVGEWKLIETVSVWTETSDEKTGRFRGYRERAPDMKVRWCLVEIIVVINLNFKHDNNKIAYTIPCAPHWACRDIPRHCNSLPRPSTPHRSKWDPCLKTVRYASDIVLDHI